MSLTLRENGGGGGCRCASVALLVECIITPCRVQCDRGARGGREERDAVLGVSVCADGCRWAACSYDRELEA